MSTVEKLELEIKSVGYDCCVEKNADGRTVCCIDGVNYTPRDAAEKFVLGGWNAIWTESS